MKPIVIALMAIVTLAFSGCNAEAEDYKSWLDNGVLIDTRTVEEYYEGNIEGSILIPYDTIAQRIERAVPDKSTPILLYCRSGRRAGIAEEVLKDMGYTQVKNLGGMAQTKAELGL